MIRLERKKGTHGIFNLTKVPKLEIETPTDKAKNSAKIKENKARGSDCRMRKNRNPDNFISR